MMEPEVVELCTICHNHGHYTCGFGDGEKCWEEACSCEQGETWLDQQERAVELEAARQDAYWDKRLREEREG